MSGSTAIAQSPRPPIWRDVRVLRVVFQVAVVGVALLVAWFLWSNLVTNLQRSGLTTGFGFIDQRLGFAIPDVPTSSSMPFWRGLLVGAKNTALVGIVGIAGATVLGVVIGVMRLSANWLVRKTAAVYVEALRNTPVLLIILLFFIAVFLRLPEIDEAPDLGRWAIISNRGVFIPWFEGADGAGLYLLLLVGGILAAGAVWWWRTRTFDATGQPHHRVAWASATFVLIAVLAYGLLGGPFGITFPERTNFGASGGIKLDVAYAALTLALLLYTASHVAEIVRGSILAVPRGQTEAARAVGLSEGQRMRLVILPQALRIMVPPLANQYLNLVKNSSLGVAISFYEVTRVAFVASSQGFPAPQVIILLMLVYLAFSLSISLVTNLVNRRLQLSSAR